MPLVTWTPELAVGVVAIDDQHKAWFQYINTFHAALSTGAERPDVGRLLDDMLGYTQYHFGNEEALMRRYGYPDMLEHLSQHKGFVDKTWEFKDRLGSGRPLVAAAVTNYLRDWITSHIRHTDTKLGAFLAQQVRR
jgi:hemerythrin-like metal-binding protein